MTEIKLLKDQTDKDGRQLYVVIIDAPMVAILGESIEKDKSLQAYISNVAITGQI